MKKAISYVVLAGIILFNAPVLPAVEDIKIPIIIGGELLGISEFDVILHTATHQEIVAPEGQPLNMTFKANAGATAYTAPEHIVVDFNDNNLKRSVRIYVDNYSLAEVKDFSESGSKKAVVMKSGLRGKLDTDIFVPMFWAVMEEDQLYQIQGKDTIEAYVVDINEECGTKDNSMTQVIEGCGPKDANGNATILYNTPSFVESYANAAFAINAKSALLAGFPTPFGCSNVDTTGDGNIECGKDTDGDGVIEFDYREIAKGQFIIHVGANYKGAGAQPYSAKLFVEIYTEAITGGP